MTVPQLLPKARPVATTSGPEGGQTSPPTPARDGFLDAVRAIAIVRVFLWHAFGAPWLSYLVASMPAMFFVSGALLDGSAARRGSVGVIADRLRRLAGPLWLFSAVGLGAVTTASLVTGQADLSVTDRLWWFLPLRDPPAAAWEGGWLSSPLWYLRAFLWLLLAAPLLWAAARRAPRAAMAALMGGVVALEWVSRHPTWPLASPEGPGWLLADFCLYGTFLVAGMRYGRLSRVAGAAAQEPPGAGAPPRPRAAVRVGLAALCAAAATAWAWSQPIPDGVANNSHVELLFVGAAWLWLGLAAQAWLRRLANARFTGALVAGLGRRAMTVYLWHSAALALTYTALDRLGVRFPPFTTAPAVIVVAVAVTATFVALFGWMEDWANRRRPTLWPSTREPARPAIAVRRMLALPLLCSLAVVALAAAPVLGATTLGHRGDNDQLAAPGRGPDGGAAVGAGTVARQPERTAARPGETAAATAGRAQPSGGPSTTGVLRPPTPSQRPKAHGWEPSATRVGGRVTAQPAAAVSAGAGQAAGAASPRGPAVAAVAEGPGGTAGVGPTSSTEPGPPGAGSNGAANAALNADLAAAVEQWRTDWGVQGVIAAVEKPGTVRWTGAFGTDLAGTPMTTGDDFVTYSITKSFVGALAMQLVDEGLLHLDDPLPALAAAPTFPYGDVLTLRMLLDHTSGLVDYHEIPAFAERDPAGPPPSAAEVVAEAGQLPLTVYAGTAAAYSGTNYLLVGLLIEQVLGYPLADELQTRLFGPLGLHATALGVAGPGSEGGAAGGVHSTIADLMDWAGALLRDGRVVAQATLAEMAAIDPASDFGLALWGFCPCTVDSDGSYHYASVGHVGATEVFRYYPATETTVVFHLSESIWERDGVESSLAALLEAAVNPEGPAAAPTTEPAGAAGPDDATYEDAPTDAGAGAGTGEDVASSDVEPERGVEGGNSGLDLVAADDAAGADG